MTTRICELLGIELPIVGFTPSPEVAVAISRAGGLGVLGAVRYGSGDELEEALSYVDAHVGGRPYGVDVVMPMKEMEGIDAGKLEAHIPDAHRLFVEGVLARFGVPPLPPEVTPPAGITAWMHAVARAQVDVALRHPVRLLANALGSPPADEARGSPGTLPMPLQGLLVADAEARMRHHQSRELLGVPVGQIVGQMNDVRPVAEVMERLVREFEEARARVAGRRLGQAPA